MSHEGLFDSTDYKQAPTADSEVRDALALDGEAKLVVADDGHLARQIAPHSLDKAHYAFRYADTVSLGMKKHFSEKLAWVELFAGPGLLQEKENGLFHDGSPLQTLGVRHPFTHYVFSDLDKKCTAALEARLEDRRVDRSAVHVLQRNANDPELHERIFELVPQNCLVVLYVDPAGLDVSFQTLQTFAEHYKHLDFLLNFPCHGIKRALYAQEGTKAGRVLNHPNALDLLGGTSAHLGAKVREHFQSQLKHFGYAQFASETIRHHKKRAPMYDLLLASRERRAVDFFEKARSLGPNGQRAFPLAC